MLVNGNPTFNKIIDNIKNIHLLDCDKYKFNITIRNNILATNKYFHWYVYLNEIIGNDDRFSVFLKRVLKMGEANGDINKCSVALYDEINRIGYIDEISKTIKIFKEKNELWTNIKLTDDCLVCPNVTICMNKMCPKYMLLNNKAKNCI